MQSLETFELPQPPMPEDFRPLHKIHPLEPSEEVQILKMMGPNREQMVQSATGQQAFLAQYSAALSVQERQAELSVQGRQADKRASQEAVSQAMLAAQQMAAHQEFHEFQAETLAPRMAESQLNRRSLADNCRRSLAARLRTSQAETLGQCPAQM